MLKNFVYSAICIMFFTYCSNSNVNKVDSCVIACVDSMEITYAEVDNFVKQELFDQLSRIYHIRLIALEEILNSKLLVLEAAKKNIDKKALISDLYAKKIYKESIDFFIKTNNYEEVVPVIERSLSYIDANTEVGQEVILERFKQSLLKKYTDSLKTAYKINKYLKKPISPIVRFSDLLVHYRGNEDSQIKVLIVSDIECDMCRKFAPEAEKLFKKYKDYVQFGYTHFGSYVSDSFLAMESAAKQGKFWELYKQLSNQTLPLDSAKIIYCAKQLNLEMEQFLNDFKSDSLEEVIQENLSKIESAGLYGTPTVLINDRIIFNATYSEIEQAILEAL